MTTTQAALQRALYRHLIADKTLDALVQKQIYESPPAAVRADLYVTFGDVKTTYQGDISGMLATHILNVRVISTENSLYRAKSVADAIAAVLDKAALSLDQGHFVSISLHSIMAERAAGGKRRVVVLQFKAITDS